MRFLPICAMCCIAATTSIASAQNVQYTQYLGSIKIAPGALPLIADSAGRLFYGTFNGPKSELRVIENPTAQIGNSTDAGTTIAVFNQFATGRGLQSLQASSSDSVFISGDSGNAALGNIWKFNPSGTPTTWTEELTFTSNVTAASPARRSGLAIINDTGNGLIAGNGFYNIHFFDYTGALVGSPLNNGTQNYMRESIFNSTDNIIYPLRNSGTQRLIQYYFSGINTSTGAGSLVTAELISTGASNGASGSAKQNGYFYKAQNQLITCDSDVTITGNKVLPQLRVWDTLDNGTSLSLAYAINGISETQPFWSIEDAVVVNNRLYVDSSTSASIFVFGPAGSSVNRWDAYESTK